MADPKRLESHGASDAADRDSRTEALLVEGLDQYFAGRYDDAIHIWTRVLFLDRSHARARAYIDRARTTLAERHRQSEELLQESHDLLEQGRTDAARHLLAEAVATGGEDEKASALRVKLERLERLERLDGPLKRRASDRSKPGAGPLASWGWTRRSPALAWVAAAAAASVLGAALISNPAVADWLGLKSSNEQLVATVVTSKWPAALSSSDVALLRARNLYTRGRLAEALQALDRVDAASPARLAADALRTEIQQMLLAGGLERFAPKADRR